MNYVNVASNMLNHEMICLKNHICDLCDPHELCGYVFSNNLNHEIICHKIHICELRGRHELCLYVSSDFLHWKMIYHRSHRSLCFVFVFIVKSSCNYSKLHSLLPSFYSLECKFCNEFEKRGRVCKSKIRWNTSTVFKSIKRINFF